MYHNGLYHFFYQYNPDGVTWGNGNLSWGHSVSVDLVNWAALDTALEPTQPFDANGCWSGSATILPDGSPVMLYTGIDANNDQVQNVAFPKNASDPLLREWVKPDFNPVIPLPADIKHDDFRDPSTAWLGHDGLWRIAVAARVDDVGGAALVYRSKDFVRWERNADPLYLANDCRSWRRLDYGHVYASKSFFDAGKNRRVLWGWANESDSVADDLVRGWSGIQTIPRKVWLDNDGKQLRQWPIEEIETLRSKRVNLLIPEMNAGGVNEIIGVVGEQADVEVVFQVPALEHADVLEPNWLLNPQSLCGEKGASVPGGIGPFGLLVMASGDMEEHTAVFFRVFRHDDKYKVLMCTDLSKSSSRDGVYKPPYGAFVDMDIEAHGGSISLRTLVDHSVVECYGGGGRTVITARVYPTHAENGNSHMYVFNNGTGTVKVSTLDAWELATAEVNVVVEELLAVVSARGAEAY